MFVFELPKSYQDFERLLKGETVYEGFQAKVLEPILDRAEAFFVETRMAFAQQKSYKRFLADSIVPHLSLHDIPKQMLGEMLHEPDPQIIWIPCEDSEKMELAFLATQIFDTLWLESGMVFHLDAAAIPAHEEIEGWLNRMVKQARFDAISKRMCLTDEIVVLTNPPYRVAFSTVEMFDKELEMLMHFDDGSGSGANSQSQH